LFNAFSVTAVTGDATALGAVTASSTVAPATISDSEISRNTMTATSRTGAATLIGGGIVNDGLLDLNNVRVEDNHGVAHGNGGFAQGGGIWNGLLFVPPPVSLSLEDTSVTGNTLTGSVGVDLEGGGVFSDGFPVTIVHGRIENNAPDDCVGC
jgi:hypothetical protein